MPRRAAAATVPAVLAADEVAEDTVPLAEDTVPCAEETVPSEAGTAGAAVPPATGALCAELPVTRSFMEPIAVRAR